LERRKREPYRVVGVCRSRSIVVVTIELVNFVVGANESILILEHVQKTAVVMENYEDPVDAKSALTRPMLPGVVDSIDTIRKGSRTSKSW
jgi:flagellar biogenesis protein FliO